MKRPRLNIVPFLICMLFAFICPLHAQKEPLESRNSCLRFTQAFYTWYVTQVFNGFKTDSTEPAWHAALKYEGNPFSAALTRALKESDAEAKADGDPVLDFDPILNSQDPAEQYVLRSVMLKNNSCLAEVDGFWSRPASDQNKKAQVLPELIFKDGRWHFVNFYYPNSTNPDNENLVSILKHKYRH